MGITALDTPDTLGAMADESTPDRWRAATVKWARQLAFDAGFDAAGVTAAYSLDETEAQASAERFSNWVEAGHAGEMEYLKRRDEQGELLRRGARVAFPWARSILVCAFNYNAAGPSSLEPATPGEGWIARYAWNGKQQGGAVDYHDDLITRLQKIETALLERLRCRTKCLVDTGPLLERDLAARAGVGWIGKNTCVLSEKLGSWLLLGVIVTSLPMESDAAALLAADRCGSCTRCIDACPTDALIQPRVMDASRCISYLTIEKKGPIDPSLREAMGRQVFGCDICQEVCPWNRRAPIAEKAGLTAREELINPSLEWLASLDDEAFRREFRGSPLARTKRHRIQRNVAIAMGNSGEKAFAPRLETWSKGEDEVLAESAAWALERLQRTGD